MELNRRDLLSNFATILDMISEVQTVVRSNAVLDISKYYTTDLPLIEIQEANETPDRELTSMRQLAFLDLVLRVYFVEWGEIPTATYETLIKKIRNQIGNNFNINNTASGAWVVGVGKVEGEMPLYHLDLDVRVKYYLDLTDV